MHELSIAESIISIVRDEMAKHGLTQVTKIKIVYGEISAIVPEALETAFEMLTVNNPLNNAVIELEMKPMAVRCGQCSHEFEPEAKDRGIMPCPKCSNMVGHEIIAGRELYIDHLEAENPEGGTTNES